MHFEEDSLGFWDRLNKLKDKYGYWNLTKLVLFVAFAIAVLLMAKNFGENFDFKKQKELVSETIQETNEQLVIEHSEKMQLRQEIKPQITNILKDCLIEMDADRAFIIELHNGSSNTAGLPFVHCTMTYEETAKNIESIDEDYQNLSLSRFSFPEYLHEHNLWLGLISDFENIDLKIANRVRANGVTFLVVATIKTQDTEIGYFGFSYCNNKEPKTKQEITDFVLTNIQKISKLLDKNIND